MKRINLKNHLSKSSFDFVNRNFTKSNYQSSGLFLMSVKLGLYLIICENEKTYLFDQYSFAESSSVAVNFALAIEQFETVQDAIDFISVK